MSILMLHCLQTQGFGFSLSLVIILWVAFCFHLAVKATEISLALAVVALPRSPLLFTWIWRLIQQAVYLALAVAAQLATIASTIRMPGPANVYDGAIIVPPAIALGIIYYIAMWQNHRANTKKPQGNMNLICGGQIRKWLPCWLLWSTHTKCYKYFIYIVTLRIYTCYVVRSSLNE